METTQSPAKKKWLIGLCVYAAVFLILLLITNLGHFNSWLSALLFILRPTLIGLAVAYLCNPFFRFFERKLFAKINPFALRRVISLIFTYLVLILIIGVLLLLIVPQLIDSILNFTQNVDAYIDRTVGELNNLLGMLNSALSTEAEGGIPPLNAEELKQSLGNFFANLRFDTSVWLDILNADTIFAIFEVVENLFLLVTDVILGLFISLYLLNTKEKRYAQIMRLRRALFSDTVNARITSVCSTADRSFGGFIRGKLLDSAMVGVLVYVAISLLGVPYAILIAAIVAITDIIPIIGPFIGVFPSAVIILLTDPGKVIPFLLCILVVQQIDGNIIAPKILGENTGVSSLCVMIAITTMGALWGLIGMILGVPLFATVLELTSAYLDKRLEKKGLPEDTESYYQAHAPLPSAAEEEKPRRFRKRKALATAVSPIGGNGSLSVKEQFLAEHYGLTQKHKVLPDQPETQTEAFRAEQDELILAAKDALQEPMPNEAAPIAEAPIEEPAQADEAEALPEEATEAIEEATTDNNQAQID